MNWYKLFYWITVAERVHHFVLAIAIVSTITMVFGIATCFGQRMIMANDNDGVENDRTRMYMSTFKRT